MTQVVVEAAAEETVQVVVSLLLFPFGLESAEGFRFWRARQGSFFLHKIWVSPFFCLEFLSLSFPLSLSAPAIVFGCFVTFLMCEEMNPT